MNEGHICVKFFFYGYPALKALSAFLYSYCIRLSNYQVSLRFLWLILMWLSHIEYLRLGSHLFCHPNMLSENNNLNPCKSEEGQKEVLLDLATVYLAQPTLSYSQNIVSFVKKVAYSIKKRIPTPYKNKNWRSINQVDSKRKDAIVLLWEKR